MKRGQLRIYLGAAPGVGKTYAALEELRRRRDRGADAIVGFAQTHSRAATEELLTGLESVPRRRPDEFDPDATLRRAPQLVLVDDLAHTNPAGSRRPKRWQDIAALLDAGIDVISTVNIQHLESVRDIVTDITGVVEPDTVPDEVVRRAEQVELVDMTPQALRRRMAHGNVHRPEKVDAALADYFRIGNLTALRELALLWLADQVEDQLAAYRRDNKIDAIWPSRERIVVALSGGPEGDTLIRRATRIAARNSIADVQAVHVAGGHGRTGAGQARNLARQRLLVESTGGTFHQVVGDDTGQALLDFAHAVNATQLVLGASRRGRLARLWSRGVGATVAARSESIDVHLVSHEEVAGKGPARRTRSVLSLRRRVIGYVATIAGLPLLTFGLTPLRDHVSDASVLLIVLTAVMGIALTGGMWPALLAAVCGVVLVNFFFTYPLYEFGIADREHVLALVIFVFVGVVGATVVNTLAATTRKATRAGAEAQTLSTLAGSVLRGDDPLPALLEQVRETFGLTSVTLLEQDAEPASAPERHDPGEWRVVASAGEPCRSPGAADGEIPVGQRLSLALSGRTLPAADQRIVEAFAMQAAVALDQRRLAAEAAEARRLEETDRLHTALLAAVSHDLRTPLASAKAAVTGLRTTGDMFSPDERAELLATADESLDRLGRLVANLLDMSRLQAGVLGRRRLEIDLEDTVPPVLDELGADESVDIRIAPAVPTVIADPGLLERILVNVVGNALRFSPPGRPPTITVSAHNGRVELRTIDYGPGVAEQDRDGMFTPFQRLGDRDNSTGVGLGLALSRGLAEAMGGALDAETTPGGGLTMVLSLPQSPTSGDETAARGGAAAAPDRAGMARPGAVSETGAA